MLVGGDRDQERGVHDPPAVADLLVLGVEPEIRIAGLIESPLAERGEVDVELADQLDYADALPEAPRALSQLESVVESSTLEPKLRELVKLRASQLNGCAYCVDMHSKDAQAIGEEAQRLHLVAVWRDAPVFNPRERAALAWTESLTLLPQSGAPDDVYQEVARWFDPQEQVALTLAIVAINGWNRLSVGFRRPAGSYVSQLHPTPA